MTYPWDEEDREIRDEETILEYVHKYYAELYAQPTVSSADKHEQEDILTLIDQLVSEEENIRLLEVPGVPELRDTVKSLPLDKSPKEDGLPAEVLRELRNDISSCCLELIKEVWHNKRIGKFKAGAIIKLIPKNEKKEALRNWHPILLLNLAYKLVGHILAKRIKDIIPKLVDEEQTDGKDRPNRQNFGTIYSQQKRPQMICRPNGQKVVCSYLECTMAEAMGEGRKSKNRWRQLQEKALDVHASFQVTHGLLETIDEAIRTKKNGGR
ncbi:hypothetical protein R1flu_024612 [Riccia fluitans]|uniref:Uncharacterized protein n=1 Tax=Riccia fluitans TaxID=41844 RepID=A0ABD1XVD1_9MARC